MQEYKDFAPTGFDSEGLGLPKRQGWLVAPVVRTRDSEPLEESNFQAALDILGGESKTVEVHRFNHWGPGWFEIILVHPSREEEVERMERSLEDYPILDEEDFAEREFEAALEYWRAANLRDRILICAKYNASIFAARREEIPKGVSISDLAQP